jgi:hypothetical protein
MAQNHLDIHFYQKSFNERDRVGDVDIDWRTILKLIIKKLGLMVWIGSSGSE